MSLINLTPDTWIVSDTHFGHDNIVRYCDRPENHEQVIVQKWNALVEDDDIVLHLGDLIFNNLKGSEYARQLKGRKFLLRGNHDNHSSTWFLDRGFTRLPIKTLFWAYGKERVLFSHEPDTSTIPWTINIHGHIHNNGWESTIDLTRDYRNVSIEVMDYRPVRLKDILENGVYQSSRSAA